jgi:hypothetical protein
MQKDTRNAIERATQRARKVLEEDFAAQLEGDFDVHHSGVVASKPGSHLSARQVFQRERVVAAIEHKRAAGMNPADSVANYVRDAAFTTLNRFVALKMLEARELVQECITKGEQSAGYREFYGMAPGIPLLPDSVGYRLYIESLFDELSTEVKVLFDRRDPSSVLWPKRATFEQLLEVLNTGELAQIWGEDETIGWVYQFFNGQDERRKMREESQAPRNSRELAVRNQFFTPRYVVQFLTDNTLGRIWYEMRETNTALAKRCEYMVRKPGEEFAPRAKKDPRDLRVLDPACGSGHFLLYAFDLLLAIYEEAHADPGSPKNEATGRTLAEDYPTLDVLRKAIPGLILAHNLHGVDIDPRCAQIAQLALWMRAQKASRDFDIARAERAQIRRSNIVVAEPLVADDQIAKEFVAKLGDAELGRVFTELVEALKLAGEMGILLRVETVVAQSIKPGQTSDLFAPPKEAIHAALARFVAEEAPRTSTRRRLFADDAAQGVGLLGVAEKKFDVIVMNPPFGSPTTGAAAHFAGGYPGCSNETSAGFLKRACELAHYSSAIGVLAPRAWLVRRRLDAVRTGVLLPNKLTVLDLGLGILDDAATDVAAYVVAVGARGGGVEYSDVRGSASPSQVLDAVRGRFRTHQPNLNETSHGRLVFDQMPLPEGSNTTQFEPEGGVAIAGLRTFKDERFLRLWWEVAPSTIGRELNWAWFARGDSQTTFLSPPVAVVNWNGNGHELMAYNEIVNGQTAQVRQGSRHYFKKGVHYIWRSDRFCPRLMPAGCTYSNVAPVVLPSIEGDLWYTLGWLASEPTRRRVETQAHKQAYTPGLIKTLPWNRPEASVMKSVETQVRSCVDAKRVWLLRLEQSALFAGVHPAIEAVRTKADWEAAVAAVLAAENVAEKCVHVAVSSINALFGAVDVEWSQVSDHVERPHSNVDSAEMYEEVVQYLLGCAFGRWNLQEVVTSDVTREPSPPMFVPRSERPSILVDDRGHSKDVGAAIHAELAGAIGDSNFDVPTPAGLVLSQYLKKNLFAFHLSRYRGLHRKAPIYWQLATPSASYSVWFYIHRFSKDTLFRVQNDYVAPKLAHEERRLESLTLELRERATAAQRKELAAQESVVEELRAFLEEVNHVAPLWNPNLDDGVIINFAPLWRLVPQHKAWQKELGSTWDALCDGKYEWAHLAMHLWPERVVPKCWKDRSLAIAHGLEDVFWVESDDGKWSARGTPTHSIDELVRQRTSVAVKSALKNLLEAPAAASNGGRRRRGRRRAAGVVDGGDA